MMRNFLNSLWLSFLACGAALAQEAVPMDSAIRSGVLANGMHYYIRHNEEPKERASFYFAQNVGSVLEKDSQRGLAHFLEHMAFNGTQNFSDKGILEFLEKHGVKFGSEINAFTSFDMTVYNLSKVPTDEEGLLDSALLVLHDWSGYLTLTDEEIDNERGVINEEWRTRNTANFRASEKIWTEGIMKGSKYQYRMPIGLMEVVNNFEYEELRDYYRQWYRPDEQAVIVVGDIDVDLMEEKIKSMFAPIPLKQGLPERPVFEMELDGSLTFIKSTDKELGDPTLEFYVKSPARELEGTDYIDDALLNSVASYVFNHRMSELVREASSPVLGVGYSYGSFIRPVEILSLSVQPKSGKIMEAFQYALTEMARFAAYEPTAGEMERAKASIKSSYLNQLNNKDKRGSDGFAKELYQHFFEDIPMPSLEWEVDYSLAKLEEITAADVQSFVASKFKYTDVVIGVKGRDDIEYPKESEFKGLLDLVQNIELEAYEEEIEESDLITEEPTAGELLGTFEVDGVDAKGYEFSNGAKVVLYSTDIDQDRVYLRAFSKGGNSLLPIELLPSAQISTSVASESGLGQLTKVALDKKLAGTNTMLLMNVSELGEGVFGNSTKTDLEVLLKKIYLSFSAPRFEQSAYDRMIERLGIGLVAQSKRIETAFNDSLSLARTNHHERTMLFSQELVDQMTFEGVQKVYEERFSNVGDFTFVFVGDFEEEELLAMSQKYIGGLEGHAAREQYVDHEYRPAKGKTLVHVSEKMETPKSTVTIQLSGEMKYDRNKAMQMAVLGQLLSKQYMDIIREQEGGSYGVQASAYLVDEPRERFGVSVQFDCAPEKTDRLVEVVYEEIERLMTEIDEKDLKEVKEAIIKQRSEEENNNNFWMGAIVSKLDNGKDILTLEEYKAIIQGITVKDLKKLAKVVNKKANTIEGVLRPSKD